MPCHYLSIIAFSSQHFVSFFLPGTATLSGSPLTRFGCWRSATALCVSIIKSCYCTFVFKVVQAICFITLGHAICMDTQTYKGKKHRFLQLPCTYLCSQRKWSNSLGEISVCDSQSSSRRLFECACVSCCVYVCRCLWEEGGECGWWRVPQFFLRRENCVSLRSLIPCGALSSGELPLCFLAKSAAQNWSELVHGRNEGDMWDFLAETTNLQNNIDVQESRVGVQ